MDVDATTLDPEAEYPFRIRLRVGDASRGEPSYRVADVVAELRQGGAALAERAQQVAAVAEALGARGWRLAGDDPAAGRDTVGGHGFAAAGAPALPQSVTLARDARPAAAAADLASALQLAGGEAALEASATVRLEGYDLPVRAADSSLELAYSLRKYVETFSIRG